MCCVNKWRLNSLGYFHVSKAERASAMPSDPLVGPRSKMETLKTYLRINVINACPVPRLTVK